MFRNVNDLTGYALRATDGVIGEVEDFYFDDEDWAVRYLVVDTGRWLSGRKVLISPLAIRHPDWMGKLLPVSLTRAKVRSSPDIDTRRPVSRQHEATYLRYFGYPYYWGGAGLWGMGAYPDGMTTERGFTEEMKARRDSETRPADDSHLRSCSVLIGHHVHAEDGDIGHVHDLLVDDRSWAIRYLIVNTSNWWGGHQVLVAPNWIESMSWVDARVTVDLTRKAIEEAPAYDPAKQLDREQEEGMHEHYGRSGYWTTSEKHSIVAPSAK